MFSLTPLLSASLDSRFCLSWNLPLTLCRSQRPGFSRTCTKWPRKANGGRTAFSETLDFIGKSGAPGGTRTPDLLVRSKVVQNSKCCFWCRLQGNAPFISLLSWTEVGLKLMGMSDSKVVEGPFE